MNVGSGHFRRAVSFSRYLGQRKINSIFVINESCRVLIDHLKTNLDNYRVISDSLDWQSETKEIDAIAREVRPSCIVLDRPPLAVPDKKKVALEYLTKLANISPILSFDGFCEVNFPYDLLVIPFPNAPDAPLNQIYSKAKNKCFGFDYFILPNEFYEMSFSRKQNNAPPRKGILFVGGHDLKESIPFYLELLHHLQPLLEPQLEVDIFLGGFDLKRGYENKLANWLKSSSLKIRIQKDSKDFYSILSRADFALLAGGLTKFEAAYLGIPSITLSLTDDQEKYTRAFATGGSVLHLGQVENLDPKKSLSSVFDFFTKKEVTQTLSNNGKRLIDGEGANRTIDKLLEILL